MKRRLRIILIVVAAIVVILAFRAYPGIGIVTHWNLRGAVTNFDRLESYIPTGAPEASKLGLPHQFFDESHFWQKLLFSNRSIIHGHAFRAGDWISSAELDEIGELLSAPASYTPWGGESMCGGFHADFYFRWKNGQDEAIICLGCGEAVLIRSGTEFRCNIESSVHDRLIEISKKAEQGGDGDAEEAV
ncbi:hypothetical protein [Luteolibacter sp. AS25]|uniref:hypothetical protein n=1 Tax=Luteolibacter sp. AS25 TaxID=3135776 RepID=UPI00398B9C31